MAYQQMTIEDIEKLIDTLQSYIRHKTGEVEVLEMDLKHWQRKYSEKLESESRKSTPSKSFENCGMLCKALDQSEPKFLQ
jgi:hypothetical protein